MRALNIISLVLIIVGGLNWGLFAINPSFDLVALIGGGPRGVLAIAVYGLVALAAVYQLFMIGSMSRAESPQPRPARA